MNILTNQSSRAGDDDAKNKFEPWSSGYGRRLAFKRLWAQIPAPDTYFMDVFTLYCKNSHVCLKRPKINKKRPGMAHLKNKI